MPFSLRELDWMLDAKTELHNETVSAIMDSIFKSMANQMALTKAIHTGRRVNPEEFYRSPKRNQPTATEAINHDGFATMKALFTKT